MVKLVSIYEIGAYSNFLKSHSMKKINVFKC